MKRLGIFKNNNNHLGPVNLNRQYLVEFGPYGPSMLSFARGLGHARYPLVPVNAEKEIERLRERDRRRDRLRQLAMEWAVIRR